LSRPIRQSSITTDLHAYLSTPVVMDDCLIGLDNRLKRLVALKIESGETIWTHRGMTNYVSMVVAGKRLLVLKNDGELLVLKVTPKSAEEERKWQVGTDGTWAHLAV